MFYAAFPTDNNLPPVIVRAARDPRPADLPTIGWVEGPFTTYDEAHGFAVSVTQRQPIGAAEYEPFWPKDS